MRDISALAFVSRDSREALMDLPDGDDLAEQIRPGTVDDVPAIAALIQSNLEIGHLLPRTTEDLTQHAHRFLVVTQGVAITGCAELAPLSRAVAEVRSLVIDERHRGRGLGSRLVEELKRCARRDGFTTLCAFTHQASVFIRLGFSIVPHPWLPEKLTTDCYSCPKFRVCGQYAVALPLNGGSLRRTPPAGQRPYQAMPPGITLRLVPTPPASSSADSRAAAQSNGVRTDSVQ
jgi:amino-acid N-acetyltransferase